MIKINIYKNGWEIKGHETPSTCYQVSLWHWVASNILYGMDKSVKEYTSSRDNKENPQEGYSWLTFTPNYKDLNWIFDDLVISLEGWLNDGDTIPKGHVIINHIDNMLDK
jgi:hypothetical protein